MSSDNNKRIMCPAGMGGMGQWYKPQKILKKDKILQEIHVPWVVPSSACMTTSTTVKKGKHNIEYLIIPLKNLILHKKILIIKYTTNNYAI